MAPLGLVIEEVKPPAINKGLNPLGTITKKARIPLLRNLLPGVLADERWRGEGVSRAPRPMTRDCKSVVQTNSDEVRYTVTS